MVSRRRFLAATSTAGAVGLAGCQYQDLLERDETDEVTVPYSMTSPPPSNAGEPGWVLIRRDEGAFTVTFDMRVCGDVDDIDATKDGTDAAYTLTLTTDLDSDDDGCQPWYVLGSFDAPTDEYELSLTIDVNGETLEEIDRSGTTTSLHQLPDLLTADVIDEWENGASEHVSPLATRDRQPL